MLIDYGAGNLRSVVKALEHVAGGRVQVAQSAERAAIQEADRLVFPGQGAMGQCMKWLRDQDLCAVLREATQDRPFLGICLGLHSLMEHSEEDRGVVGLEVFPGRVRRFPTDAGCKVPHIGWNQVRQSRAHPLWHGVADGSRFYFAHSYYVEASDPACVAGRTDYICDYASALVRGPLFATQFHPEKSQQAGLQLLRNFVHWRPG